MASYLKELIDRLMIATGIQQDGRIAYSAKEIIRDNVHEVLADSALTSFVYIKPLEWTKSTSGEAEVVSIVGVYRIQAAWNGGYSVTRSKNSLYLPDGRTNFPTIEDAKAAAQVDYEKIVRSVLIVPALGEAVAEIVSAHGDPEAFGERELIARVNIQKFPYRTKLYAAPEQQRD